MWLHVLIRDAEDSAETVARQFTDYNNKFNFFYEIHSKGLHIFIADKRTRLDMLHFPNVLHSRYGGN